MREAIPMYLVPALLACAGCNRDDINGEVIEVDGGGETRGPCNLGDSCRNDTECGEGTCVSGTCTAASCANGQLDPGETDLDCGGTTCGKCAGGRTCASDCDCFSNSCDASSHTCSALATVSFADQVSYPSGFKSYALFAGDLDGDGRVDLVAANELGSTLSVFLGTGTGTFQPLASGEDGYLTGEYPTGGGLYDFNHDGIPDAITADYHGNSVSILLGTPSGSSPGKGTGALAGLRSFPTCNDAETSNLAVGDLNGDGNLDVIATNQAVVVPAAASVSQFMGRADGTLEPATTAPIGDSGRSSPYSVAMGDFDGNGTQDVAIADNLDEPVIVKLGNGDGTFQAETPYSSGGVGATFIITYDMNVDGKLDLVCANRNSDNVSVLLGRGDGTFREAIVTALGATPLPLTDPAQIGPYSLAVADFNRDGVPDVVTSDYLTSTATVLLGVGNGHFGAPIDAGAVGSFTYGVAVGDFNGDGKPDFATANALSNDVTVKLNTSH